MTSVDVNHNSSNPIMDTDVNTPIIDKDDKIVAGGKLPPIPPSIYFGGCAYGSCYYVGVYRAMLETWGADFAEKTLLAGDSAGIILTVGIRLKYPPEFIGQIYCNTGKETPWGLIGKDPMRALDRCTLQKLLTGPDESTYDKETYKKVNNTTWIGGSHFPGNHYWVDCWESDADFLDTMRNSLNMPVVVHRRYHTKYKGKEMVDGAFCLTGTIYLF
jgi:hypothetical protein